MDLAARFLEILQEIHKVLGHLFCVETGVAANGWTGTLSLLGF